MKIFRLTSVSQWAYLIAVVLFLTMVFWVSVTFKPESSPIGNDGAQKVAALQIYPTVSNLSPSPSSVPADLPPTIPSATIAPLPSVTPDTRCIITIDGQRYDVSIFRRQHEGGDVFRCGSDMSEKFHDKHPNSFLTKIKQFRI